MPALVGPEEAGRLADDHKIMAQEGMPRENAGPISQDNTMVLEPPQSPDEVPRKAPARALPVVENTYRNPRAYNPCRGILDSYRTGGSSREQSYAAPQANAIIEAASPKIPGLGMAVSASPGVGANAREETERESGTGEKETIASCSDAQATAPAMGDAPLPR